MLTGKRAFEGEDVSDTLAAVLRGEPDWAALPATTPAPIVKLLRGCLEKDRKERVPDIAVARLDIKEALAIPAGSIAAAAARVVCTAAAVEARDPHRGHRASGGGADERRLVEPQAVRAAANRHTFFVSPPAGPGVFYREQPHRRNVAGWHAHGLRGDHPFVLTVGLGPRAEGHSWHGLSRNLEDTRLFA